MELKWEIKPGGFWITSVQNHHVPEGLTLLSNTSAGVSLISSSSLWNQMMWCWNKTCSFSTVSGTQFTLLLLDHESHVSPYLTVEICLLCNHNCFNNVM